MPNLINFAQVMPIVFNFAVVTQKKTLNFCPMYVKDSKLCQSYAKVFEFSPTYAKRYENLLWLCQKKLCLPRVMPNI
jgi:hypothetical protein